MTTPTAAELLKLADEVRDGTKFAYPFNGIVKVREELMNRIEQALRTAASQDSAGGERSEVQTDDLVAALNRVIGHDPTVPGLSYDTVAQLLTSAAHAAKDALAALGVAQASPKHDRRVYFGCECCEEHAPENGVNCREDIGVMPDGTWLCDGCYSDCDKSAYGMIASDVDDFEFPRFEDLPRPAPYEASPVPSAHRGGRIMQTLPQTSDDLRNEAVVITQAADRCARSMVAAMDAVRAAHARAREIEAATDPFLYYLKRLREKFPESTPETIIVGGPYNLTYAHFDALAAALAISSTHQKSPT